MNDNEDMELDRICCNCTYFFSDTNDIESGFGVCTRNDTFEEFIDEILEYSDFKDCMPLYMENRFDGDCEVCQYYEEIDLTETTIEEIKMDLRLEQYRTMDIDGQVKMLYSDEAEQTENAMRTLIWLSNLGNESASYELLKYYNDLPPAKDLDDVHRRVDLVKHIGRKCDEKEVVDAYINEIKRSDSNNTTRQLFTAIIERLERLPLELVEEPVVQLLKNKRFAAKLEKRIQSIIFREPVYRFFW